MRRIGIPRLEVSEAGLREGAIWWWSRHGHLNLPVESPAEAGGAAPGTAGPGIRP
jgi:exopolyphosphatase/pppGpp-phosphohydrolase